MSLLSLKSAPAPFWLRIGRIVLIVLKSPPILLQYDWTSNGSICWNIQISSRFSNYLYLFVRSVLCHLAQRN